MNDYKVGDWGKAVFICKKGWKAPTECFGIITDIDLKCVAFTDNDGNEYIIPKNRFTFEKKLFKDLSKI
jgi:hypothetical protein